VAAGVRDLLAVPPDAGRPDLAVTATFDDPTTGESTTVRLSGASSVVSVDRTIPDGPGDRPRLLGAVSVTGSGSGGDAIVAVPLPADVDPANASAYLLSPRSGSDGDWIAAGGSTVGGSLRVVVSAAAGTTETVAVFAAPSATVSACPTVGRARAADLDGDGTCEDVDGDGRFDFADVVALLFFDTDRLSTPAERAALDFDRDGRVGFGDVVTLLFRV
jgi:PKD repeat protein